MSGTVVHVVPQLTRGGGGRAVLSSIGALSEIGAPVRSRIVSLRNADPKMSAEAIALGIPLLDAPGPEVLRAELEAADVVQVGFWNSPELLELLDHGLPPCRLVLWLFVAGTAAPQVVSDDLVALADLAVACGRVPGRADLELVPAVLDPARVEGVERREHEGFVVGYIGTVDPSKMHPGFVDLCVSVDRDDARFVVAGMGDGFATIAAEAERRRARDRFDLRGWVDDVGAELAGFDVFGYPLRPDNYGTAELVIQEAMTAGVPPVVLPYGGAAAVVEDGRTGLVAADEREYPRALERLAADPGLRRRLGDAAREHALAAFSGPTVARRWAELYGEVLELPKRSRSLAGAAPRSGADLFLASLGTSPERATFGASRGGRAADAAVADDEIARGATVLGPTDGGILDYRRRFPEDPWLRYWSGLTLEAMGRPALAAGELTAAARLGIDPRRTESRLATLIGAAA